MAYSEIIVVMAKKAGVTSFLTNHPEPAACLKALRKKAADKTKMKGTEKLQNLIAEINKIVESERRAEEAQQEFWFKVAWESGGVTI